VQGIGTSELIIIAVILLLLFGGRKLPEFGRGMGEAIKDFKHAVGEEDGKKKKKK